MSVLITGSNGFIGRNIIDYYTGDLDLVLLNRSESNHDGQHKFFKKEINSSSDYSDCFEGVSCIVHCAARTHVMADECLDALREYREVNTAGTINLAKQSVDHGVKRFIFISSIKVNGENTNNNIPFNSKSPRLPQDFYGQSKSEAEEALIALSLKTGLEVVIIRPTLVYGAGVKANFASLMHLTAKGFPLPFGCINNNIRSLVSVKNLADLVILCIDHPKAGNEVFLVSDDHDVSTSDIVKHMAWALGESACQIPLPVSCYRLAGKIFSKEDVVDRLVGSLQVDMSHTKETLGWKPPQSLESGFKETADFILNP